MADSAMRRFLALLTLLACSWLGDAHAFQGVVTKGTCYRYPDGAVVGGVGTQYETKSGCGNWASLVTNVCSAAAPSGPDQNHFAGYANWNTYPFRQYYGQIVTASNTNPP